MLNLNTMFDISYAKSNNVEIPNVENNTQNIYLTDVALARIDADIVKCGYQGTLLDQTFNMYQHVKKYGIDRTFLSLYNRAGELNDAIGCKFPSCESVDYVGSPYSTISTTFIAAMEDEQKGLFRRILDWIKRMIAAIRKGIEIVGRWLKYHNVINLRSEVNDILKRYANKDVDYSIAILDYKEVIAQGTRYLNAFTHIAGITASIKDNIEKHPDDLGRLDESIKEVFDNGTAYVIDKTGVENRLGNLYKNKTYVEGSKSLNEYVIKIFKMVQTIIEVQQRGTLLFKTCSGVVTALDNEIKRIETNLDKPETQNKLQVYKRALELINKLRNIADDMVKWSGKSSDNVIKRLHQAIAEGKQKAEAKTADDKTSATEPETNVGNNFGNLGYSPA